MPLQRSYPVNNGRQTYNRENMNTSRRSFRILIIVVIVLAAAHIAGAQKNSSPWKPGPRMKFQRWGHMMESVGGKLYVMGGLLTHKSGPIATSSVQVLDRTAGSWKDRASLPAPVVGGGSAVLDGMIYVAGGEDGSGRPSPAVYRYDVAADEWTTVAPMRVARSRHAVVAFDGKLFAIGGNEPADVIGATRKSALAVYTIEVFDPAANEWTIRAQLPFKHFTLGAVVVSGKIYILSDSTDNRRMGEAALLEEYDPARNGLQAKEKLIKPKRDAAMVAGNDRFFLIGGRRDRPLGSVEEYDLVLDQWTWKSSLPFPLYDHRAVNADGTIVVTGGISPSGEKGRGKKSDLLIYLPQTDRVTEVVR